MSTSFFWCAVRYGDGFIMAMTISRSHLPAVQFSLRNLGYYVALFSVGQIKHHYEALGIQFSFPRTYHNPFAG